MLSCLGDAFWLFRWEPSESRNLFLAKHTGWMVAKTDPCCKASWSRSQFDQPSRSDIAADELDLGLVLLALPQQRRSKRGLHRIRVSFLGFRHTLSCARDASADSTTRVRAYRQRGHRGTYAYGARALCNRIPRRPSASDRRSTCARLAFGCPRQRVFDGFIGSWFVHAFGHEPTRVPSRSGVCLCDAINGPRPSKRQPACWPNDAGPRINDPRPPNQRRR